MTRRTEAQVEFRIGLRAKYRVRRLGFRVCGCFLGVLRFGSGARALRRVLGLGFRSPFFDLGLGFRVLRMMHRTVFGVYELVCYETLG